MNAKKIRRLMFGNYVSLLIVNGLNKNKTASCLTNKLQHMVAYIGVFCNKIDFLLSYEYEKCYSLRTIKYY